ncbi:unnamed protein product [Moneuplotes crassus]|uniref:Uncharacterized protein n=1 Tax=Euplotes crassus TaxID=5936 RepID=A0AAD1XQN1_EUPCR|nr:unnamed protein product [Moneuplotes crassus]
MDGGDVRNHSKNKMSTKTLNYSLFSPKSKPKKSRFLNKNEKVRRVAKKPTTDPRNLMKERFQRIKSLSPMQRILNTVARKNNRRDKSSRNIAKFRLMSGKMNQRAFSPAAKLIRNIIRNESSSFRSSSKKNSKRGTPSSKFSKRKLKLNLKDKFSKFMKQEKSKKKYNIRISKIFGGSILSPSKQNMSQNTRYSHISMSEPHQDQLQDINKRKSEFVPLNPTCQKFEVYRSMNQDDGSPNILSRFLKKDTLNSSEGFCFPRMKDTQHGNFLDAFTPK